MFNKKHKLVLALSGGVDSVVMAHLLKKGGFNFTLAHCNFKLRGNDSEADEKFCRQLAGKLKVNIYVNSFNTKTYAANNKLSIQMAARELRYGWFEELLNETGSDFLVTAHHSNDLVETMFINLLRGTGIKGLKGISEKNGRVVRPLVRVSKADIEAYAKKHKIKYRLDKSNLDDKYERNFMRLHIIPKLKQLHPELERTFAENAHRFGQEAGMVHDFLQQRLKELVKTEDETLRILKEKLRTEKYAESLLHFVLKPLGFNVTQQANILKNVMGKSLVGRKFVSPTHVLTIDRKEIIVQTKRQDFFAPLLINDLNSLEGSGIFRVTRINEFALPAKDEVVLDPAQLIFPLTLRKTKTGDKFKPFGMKGFKLLSDFMKDQKLNGFEKENCKLLVNGNGEIMWVAGYRSDERYRITGSPAQLLKLKFIGR